MAFFTLTPKQEYEKALDFKKKYDDSCSTKHYNPNQKYYDKWREHLKKAAEAEYPEAMADYGQVFSNYFNNIDSNTLYYIKKAADFNIEKGILGYGIYLASKNQNEEALSYFERLPITKDLVKRILPLIKGNHSKIISVLERAYPNLKELPYDYIYQLLEAYRKTKQDQKEYDFLMKIYNPDNGAYALQLSYYYRRHNEMQKAFDVDYNFVSKTNHFYDSKQLMIYAKDPNFATKVYNYYSSKFYTYKTNADGTIVLYPEVTNVTNDNKYYAQCLADCYYNGYGTKKNVSLAIPIYKKLVELETNKDTLLILSRYYYQQKNYSEAAKYLSKYPGEYLPLPTFNSLDKEVYVEKAKVFFETQDYKQAFTYLVKALPYANQHPFIYDHLARCYIDGLGTTKDEKKGFEYAKKAAELDFPEGLHLYGFCYSMGKGVAKDEKKSLEIYLAAEAKYHLPQTQRNIGILYAYGQAGLTKDLYKAREWFTKAAKQNHKLSQDSLTWVNNQIHIQFEGPKAPCKESMPL